MSEFRLSFPACVVAGKNRLSAEDIFLLRKFTFPEGIQTPDDVVTLLALNNSCPEKCPEWRDFFVESLTRFIVDRCYPIGSMDDLNVDWMKRVFSVDGVVHDELELAVVLHVMDVSRHVPPTLKVLALDQLRVALSEGRGALAVGRPPQGGIGETELAYVHRILRSAFDRGRIDLYPIEIAALEEIDRIASSRSSHPEWTALMNGIRRSETDKGTPVEPPRRWLQVPDALFLDENKVA